MQKFKGMALDLISRLVPGTVSGSSYSYSEYPSSSDIGGMTV
jgi:hypothetical protein